MTRRPTLWVTLFGLGLMLGTGSHTDAASFRTCDYDALLDASADMQLDCPRSQGQDRLRTPDQDQMRIHDHDCVQGPDQDQLRQRDQDHDRIQVTE